MKLIAIEISWYFIIGVVALIIALSILIFWKENVYYLFYCKIYTRIFSFEKIPKECNIEEKIETITISGKNEKEIMKLFVSYILKCWLDAERYNNLKTHYCFKIDFKDVLSFKIFPENISSILIEYDNCKTLQFKKYKCGYRDDIIWNIEKSYIDENDTVIIKYLDTNQIEIIA